VRGSFEEGFGILQKGEQFKPRSPASAVIDVSEAQGCSGSMHASAGLAAGLFWEAKVLSLDDLSPWTNHRSQEPLEHYVADEPCWKQHGLSKCSR
jgi:hypothetical protein